MIIFPAIDISEGRCVRLLKGDYKKKTIYYDDPLDAAHRWKDQGSTHLHVVDLDGAKLGYLKHLAIVKNIAKQTGLIVQMGGGIRSLTDIKRCLDAGISYPIIGTKAITEKHFLEKAYDSFSDHVIVGIDSKNGFVATQGWMKTSFVKANVFAQSLDSLGIKRIICTDIETDGTLNGPNFDYYLDLLKWTKNIKITVSGGISSLEDVTMFSDLNNDRIAGIIIGKALYENCFSLKDVLSQC